MQDMRGDHVSRDLPQVLVRAIYGLWQNWKCLLHQIACEIILLHDNNAHEKSLEMIGQSTIRQMAWQLSSVFCSLIYKDRFFNRWQRALDPNFFIINNSSAIIYAIQTQLASIILLLFTEKSTKISI